MARFRYKHLQSTVENKVPSDLLDGEIAVNRFAGKEKLFIKNTSGNVISFSSSSEIDDKLADKLDVSDFNTYSGAVDTSINSKASQSDLNTLSGTVTGHTADTTIHLTSTEKGQLHTHSNKSALDAITGNVGTMAYEDKTSYSSATQVNTALASKLESSDIANFFDGAKYEDSGTTKVINFYHGDTIKSTINADEFIKDGMISGVTLESKSGTTYLVIEWNTDAGIQTTELNIGDLFEADNYYTKANIDDKLGSGFTSSSVTEVIESNERAIASSLNDLETNKLDVSDFNTYSGAVNTSIGSKASQSDLNTLSGTVTGHTANTTIHLTSTEKGQLHTHSNKSTLDAITASSTAINSLTGSVGTMAFQNTSSYSSATQVNTALTSKSDTSHTHVSSAVTAMTGYAKAASGSSIATGDTLNQAIGKLEASVDDKIGRDEYEDDTETIASALVDLDSRVSDCATKAEDLDGIKIKKITQSDYDALVQAGTVDSNTLYFIY